MKAVFEDIQAVQGNSSFYAYRFKVPFFEFKWHYHPEYELTYIMKGNGYRIIGNSYDDFASGDLVLLGSNLPHTWSEKPSNENYSEAIVIQFSEEFILPFLRLNESLSIKKMLNNASRGIQFKISKALESKMIEITQIEGMDKVLKLIAVLNELSGEENTFITENPFHNVVSKKNSLRINKVCLFIQNNFNNKIALKQAADLIYLTESNFCKFFKKATGKTYSDYLNEMRINEACRLLLQTEKSVNQIAFDCGFETLSYFNRVFLNKKKVTPSGYRKQNLD
jgi:AraC-like DNA-binding protein